MDIIRIKFYGNIMYVSYVKNHIGNINTCQMNEYNEFYLSVDYLKQQYEILRFYIAPIIESNQVTNIIISDRNLLYSIRNILNLNPSITKLCIKEDEELTISDVKEIIELKYIDEINCYEIASTLYYELLKKYNKKINSRCELLFESDFMNSNKIDTSTKVYGVKEVILKNELEKNDKEDFEYLLEENNVLEKINLEKYSKKDIEYLLPILKERNISLSVLNDKSLNNKEFNYLKGIKKKSKVQLELSYSKQYQQKHAIKQLNVTLLRFCMVLVVFVCVGFASAEHFIFEQDKEEIEQLDLIKYEEIMEEEVIVEEPAEPPVEEPVIEEPAEEPVEKKPTYVSPYYKNYSQVFSELKQINQDTVGWIKVNNTKINYPVVKTNDNSYYLNHSFDKSQNSFGWIYADYRSNFNKLNQNTILYGHHVLGTDLLFSTLTKTLDPNWYNNNNNLTITFNTEKENIKWQIFSIYLIPVTNDYLITNFNSEASFLSFVQKLKSRSVKDFGVEVKGNDQIITLSTCYKDSSSRVVVHAKRIY